MEYASIDLKSKVRKNEDASELSSLADIYVKYVLKYKLCYRLRIAVPIFRCDVIFA